MTRTGTVLAGIGALALSAGVIVGGYQLDWWLKKDSTNRQAEIDQNNKGTQTAYVETIGEAMRDAVVLEAGPQRAAIVAQACDLIDKLTPTYYSTDIAAFDAANC